jgi:hypothetical protein
MAAFKMLGSVTSLQEKHNMTITHIYMLVGTNEIFEIYLDTPKQQAAFKANRRYNYLKDAALSSLNCPLNRIFAFFC